MQRLLGPSWFLQMIESISEAHVLAEKTGLPAESLHKVINAVFGGPFTFYSNRTMSGSYYREVSIMIFNYDGRSLASKACDSNWNCKS
jgi:3-hydroxyisobutyrate dehydrogenase-like beta-hydroxyacid dehydrogenase